jgi:hypothetical protein
MPAILHLLRLSAVVALDTSASAEQAVVIYHHCLLEENCGQKLPQKSEVCVFPSSHDLKDISELTADEVGGEGLQICSRTKVGELIGQ